MKNIEIYEELSALTMAKLYDQFPRSVDIDPMALAILLPDDLWSESTEMVDGNPNHHQYIRGKSPAGLAVPTIKWLASSGLITYARLHNGIFEETAFTPKGFELASKNSSSMKRVAKYLSDLGKGVGKELLMDGIKSAIKELIQSIFMSASSPG
ncbi:conserved hypothetical protein [Limnobacter sp. 130]|uniref:hypothetical protein n=1 Tax=Limnobacter sp. 130 TaxID=2653147 RepID=UPI0012F46A77|nr:hypothetical protein [Limnobacter sp. 130]VWX35564.1 conserved hypothetical protein [Limnobacter sp. 130]